MRQSGRTTLFVLICIAVLTAAYGVGLGVRKMRAAGIKIHISMGDDTQKPADEPEPESKPRPAVDVVAAVEEPSNEEEPVEEAPEEQPETQTARAEGADLRAKKEWFQNLSEEEQQEMIAKKRKPYAGKGRSEGRNEGRGAFQQLSEEDRDNFRAKMEALGAKAKAGEISEEEMRQARGELLQEYGVNLQRRGGRRSGARQ